MHSVSGPEAQVFHSSLRWTEEHNSLLGLRIVDLHFEPKFCALWPLHDQHLLSRLIRTCQVVDQHQSAA